jgi:hypothetical protein
MPTANTIATVEALMADGSVVAYRDADPQHIREGRWAHINSGDVNALSVVLSDGTTFSVDCVHGFFLMSGELIAGGPTPTTKLRPVYYKAMVAGQALDGISEVGSCSAVMLYFVVGWQTTVGGRNQKLGVRVYPDDYHWELTEDI